jgi:hypothetical protein
MAINHIIHCGSRDLVLEYCHSMESTEGYTVPPFFVKFLPGRSNRGLPYLPMHMHAKDMIPTILKSNIYFRLGHPNALTLTWLWSYKIFKVSQRERVNNSVCHWRFLNFRMLWDAFPYCLSSGIPPKEGVPYHLQCKLRTAPSHIYWIFLASQMSLNAWLPPCLLRCDWP